MRRSFWISGAPARSAVCPPVATPVSASRPAADRLHPCAMTGRRSNCSNMHGGRQPRARQPSWSPAGPRLSLAVRTCCPFALTMKGTQTDARRARRPRAHSPGSRRRQKESADELGVEVDVAWCCAKLVFPPGFRRWLRRCRCHSSCRCRRRIFRWFHTRPGAANLRGGIPGTEEPRVRVLLPMLGVFYAVTCAVTVPNPIP